LERRSLLYVLVVPDATALTKIAWSFYYGSESGLARLPPSSIGLIARNTVNLYVPRTGFAGSFRFGATGWWSRYN
ncbi:MAG: hypothetical protein M3266_03245, partial [Actinomycetota bacterium]|nr:hypothetical protein [Actinomycetota bacterium]